MIGRDVMLEHPNWLVKIGPWAIRVGERIGRLTVYRNGMVVEVWVRRMGTLYYRESGLKVMPLSGTDDQFFSAPPWKEK